MSDLVERLTHLAAFCRDRRDAMDVSDTQTWKALVDAAHGLDEAADKLEAMQAALERIVEATKYVENPYARDAHKLARAALNATLDAKPDRD